MCVCVSVLQVLFICLHSNLLCNSSLFILILFCVGGIQVEVIKTSAKLQWTDGAQNGRPITRYTVSARTHLNSTWFIMATGEF